MNICVAADQWWIRTHTSMVSVKIYIEMGTIIIPNLSVLNEMTEVIKLWYYFWMPNFEFQNTYVILILKQWEMSFTRVTKMWLSTTRWGSLRGIEIFYSLQWTQYSTHFDAKNHYNISINSYILLNIDTYGSIKIHFAEVRALKDCNLCANLWVNQGGNVP